MCFIPKFIENEKKSIFTRIINVSIFTGRDITKAIVIGFVPALTWCAVARMTRSTMENLIIIMSQRLCRKYVSQMYSVSC